METLLCYLLFGTISALIGWVFLVDHQELVTSAKPESVIAFYDWFGSLQDWQRFYESPAVDILIKQCNIEQDSHIFEFGFGTGYLANQLLMKYSKSNYIGVDVSKTMYNLTMNRLLNNKKIDNKRYEIKLTKDTIGALKAIPNDSIDIFISTFVFDLLSKESMYKIINELRLKLKKQGRICLTSLTNKIDKNENILSKIILNGWNTISRFCPLCMGGCRPIDLNYPFQVQHTLFSVIYQSIYIQYGLPSQILIAQRVQKKANLN